MPIDYDIKDLRDWLKIMEAAGELIQVDGADWHLEIGGISRMNYKRDNSPALLFDNIKGYPEGFRVLTASVSNAYRTAMTLRLGEGLGDAELVDALQGKPNQWAADAAKFDPVEVETVPVFENVQTGDDIDLNVFPTPFWNELDGGRYIGTGCIVFTRDPDTGSVNGGAYRMQIQEDGKSATVNAVPGKHGAQHIKKWLERGERVPVSASIGQDPLYLILAGTEVPTGISEVNYAGAILGEPVEVVTSDITGLPIMRSSEIVIEGFLTADKQYPEGPFAEWTGHYSGGASPVLSLTIERVLYRNEPIMLGSPPGKPPHDFSYMRTAVKSSMIKDSLEQSGLSGIKTVWAHESGGGRMFIAVSMQQRYCGHSRQVALATAACQQAAYMNKYVVVVDDDVDPTDLDEVIWAMCSRCDPAEDIDVLRKTWGSKVDPLLTDESAPYNSRAIIDACRPFERIDSFPPVAQPSEAFAAQIKDKWGHIYRG